MQADGSERQVLTRPDAAPVNGPYGDVGPKASPDGSRMVFSRSVADEDSRRYDGDPVTLMISSIDGFDQRVLIKSSKKYMYKYPSWMPDGTVLVSRQLLPVKRHRSSLLTIDPDSGEQRVLFTLPLGKGRRARFETLEISHPAASPDGRKVLFTVGDEWSSEFPGRLEVLNIASGSHRILNRNASGGAWSPDGTSIVYSAYDGNDEVCGGDGCHTAMNLFTLKLNGGKPGRLTASVGDERNADWSADGTRVVFQSNRNMPESIDATEIYSVTPTGKCLTWLTNGTPASSSPSWLDSIEHPPTATDCGARGLLPLLEVEAPKKNGSTPDPYLWLGERVGSLLFSGEVSDSRAKPEFTYEDCALFEPARCGSAAGTYAASTCRSTGMPGIFYGSWRKRRGVPFVGGSFDGGRFAMFLTGGTAFMLYASENVKPAEFKLMIRSVRPVGEEPKANLPALGVPAALLKKMKVVVKSFRTTGSVRTTAKRLDLKPVRVRRFLNMNRELRKFAPVTVLRCGKKTA